MAKESELILVRTLEFDPSVFPGYRHSTTDPQVKAEQGEAGQGDQCSFQGPTTELTYIHKHTHKTYTNIVTSL